MGVFDYKHPNSDKQILFLSRSQERFPTGSFVPFTIILECSSGKAMQLKSNALPNLIWRLKPAINPATRFFLVALFIVGFASTYFGDPRSKTHPQYAANAGVFSCKQADPMYVRNAPDSKLGNAARGIRCWLFGYQTNSQAQYKRD
jgi:hypothetical protein